MNTDLRATEFRMLAESQIELRQAARDHDWHTARLALEEIEAIEMHSNWSALRARCYRVRSEYAH
jgi:hypothetical protein